MKLVSNIYKSVDIDSEVLHQLIDDYHDGDVYGYFLIDGKLVPKSLVSRLFSHLCEYVYDYGYVYSIEQLIGAEFWSTLDDSEKSVMGGCLLIVIENRYAIAVPKELVIEH